MPYKVAIRKNATGEVRLREMPYDWRKPDGSDDLLWWTDGNFGCDCNRELEFERAAGGDPGLDEVECGNEAYSVLYAELPDGERVVVDENVAPTSA